MSLLSVKKSLVVASVVLATTSLATSVFAMQGHGSGHGNCGDMSKSSHMKKAMMKDYSEAEFKKSLANGDMIIVDIYKDGCPVCARQHPTLEKATSIYPNTKFFRVNFDKDKQAVKKFRAGSQSTIIVFNKGKEINRSVGQVKEKALLRQFANGKM